MFGITVERFRLKTGRATRGSPSISKLLTLKGVCKSVELADTSLQPLCILCVGQTPNKTPLSSTEEAFKTLAQDSTPSPTSNYPPTTNHPRPLLNTVS